MSYSVVASSIFQLMVSKLCAILQVRSLNYCPSASIVVGSYYATVISYLICSMVLQHRFCGINTMSLVSHDFVSLQ